MPDAEHFRKLERMYRSAPISQRIRCDLRVSEGEATVEMEVRPDHFHAAGALHGSLLFKVLDDCAFFAANSLVDDVFVLTTSFTVYFTRPVSQGTVTGTGRVVQPARRLMVVEARVVDEEGRQVALGSGTFLRSRRALTPEIGYR